MKRNMDLIRQLAMKIESANTHLMTREMEVENFSSSELYYHCVLMNEAGLVEAHIADTGDEESEAIIYRLTWKGHDFLDAARDEKLWNQITKAIKGRVTSVTFEGLVDLLKASAMIAVTRAIEILP